MLIMTEKLNKNPKFYAVEEFIDASLYKISIQKGVYGEVDGFEATVEGFPDLYDYGDTWQEAYEIIIDSIETLEPIFKEMGKDFPSPRSTLKITKDEALLALYLGDFSKMGISIDPIGPRQVLEDFINQQ